MNAGDSPQLHIVVASYLEPEWVERIAAVDSRVTVHYRPDLVAPPRYAADHTGGDFERSPSQEKEWLELLATADVLFDFDRTHLDDLPEVAPRVRWIQATSAGIGRTVADRNYASRMPDTVITTASGVHAQPLTEFCLLAMLSFSRDLDRIQEDQRRSRWARFAGTDLAGRTLVIVGVGRIGTEVARCAQALRMRVVGVKRTLEGSSAAKLHCDQLLPAAQLADALRQAEFLVLVAPDTDATRHLVGPVELALLPPGAVLINIGRGSLVDETALVTALEDGHLAGAALDVFETEPLPPGSPLWDLRNVLVSPHSASTSDRENGRITDLFCDNLRRYLDGRRLRNVFDIARMY